MTLSVCFIVKNEEKVLARCLEGVLPFADEIVVADTGSTDRTVEIAKSFNAKVFSFPWCNDFAAARNFSFSKATCDYVMWLDADDVITRENAEKIVRLKENLGDCDVVFMRYCAAFENGRPTFVYMRERIFRRSMNFVWEGPVHEVISPRGKVLYSDAEVHHKKVEQGDSMRNLKIYQNLIARGISLDERQKFYYGRELYYNKMLLESSAVLQNFLKGNGWSENKAEACLTLYYIHRALGDEEGAIAYLLKSLLFAEPKSEFCCLIGEYFFNEGKLNQSIFWYKRAVRPDEDVTDGGFYNLDYGGFIPYMQLCVLYDRLGDRKTAEMYNELAGRIKPQNKNYLHNKSYFQAIKNSR